jgi:hypothetical protein
LRRNKLAEVPIQTPINKWVATQRVVDKEFPKVVGSVEMVKGIDNIGAVFTYTEEEIMRGGVSEVEKAVNPSHYKQFSVETIDMMERIWGIEALILHCEMTCFKYKMRSGKKDDVVQEQKKADWYLNKAQELRGRLAKESNNA